MMCTHYHHRERIGTSLTSVLPDPEALPLLLRCFISHPCPDTTRTYDSVSWRKPFACQGGQYGFCLLFTQDIVKVCGSWVNTLVLYSCWSNTGLECVVCTSRAYEENSVTTPRTTESCLRGCCSLCTLGSRLTFHLNMGGGNG